MTQPVAPTTLRSEVLLRWSTDPTRSSRAVWGDLLVAVLVIAVTVAVIAYLEAGPIPVVAVALVALGVTAFRRRRGAMSQQQPQISQVAAVDVLGGHRAWTFRINGSLLPTTIVAVQAWWRDSAHVEHPVDCLPVPDTVVGPWSLVVVDDLDRMDDAVHLRVEVVLNQAGEETRLDRVVALSACRAGVFEPLVVRHKDGLCWTSDWEAIAPLLQQAPPSTQSPSRPPV